MELIDIRTPDKLGRIVIPAKMRRALNITPETMIRMEMKNGEIVLKTEKVDN